MITIENFEELRKKISIAKEKQSRLNGALDQIEEQLKEESIKSIDEAEKMIVDLDKEKNEHIKKEDEMLDKLEKIVDWENL